MRGVCVDGNLCNIPPQQHRFQLVFSRVDFAFFRAVRFFDSTIDMSQSPVTQFAVQRRDIETSLCTLSLSSSSIDNVKAKVLYDEDNI